MGTDPTPAPPNQGKTILGVSKQTISAILTGLIGTFSSVMTFTVPQALLNPNQAHTWLWINAGANLASIILKVWLGVVTGDAPTT